MWFDGITKTIGIVIPVATVLRVIICIIQMQTSDNPDVQKRHIINAIKFAIIATVLSSIQIMIKRYLL